MSQSRRNEVKARNRAAIDKVKPKSKHAFSGGDGSAKPGLPTRRTAHRLLGAIIETKTSFDALTDENNGHPHYLSLDKRDRALLRAILMVALRYRAHFSDVLSTLIEKPLPAGATALQNVLHVAMAQILFLDVPDHSAVDLAVESANRDPRLRRFASLVNAVTRRTVRQKQKIIEQINEAPPRSSDWFSARLTDVYGLERAARIEQMHRLEAPLDFTVRDDGDVNDWAKAIGGDVLPIGSVRRPAGDIEIPMIDGFTQGAWWVQDAAASIPVKLFGNIAGLRALDLCAAPGGKTAQLAAKGAEVTALDMSANRLKRLNKNLERLGLDSRTKTVATSLFDFEPAVLFDAVLLDAPCSSTGTVRRHPDIPWTKGPEDIEKLADLQGRMLDKAAQFVAPGGRLVFSNCSLDPLEGEAVADAFSMHNSNFQRIAITPERLPGLESCITSAGYVRTTPADLRTDDPHLSGLDGFFAAMFERKI